MMRLVVQGQEHLLTELLPNVADPWHIVLELVIVLAAAAWVWSKALKPAWRFLTGVVNQRDRQNKLNKFADHWRDMDDVQRDAARWEILREIADQFKPNGGETLYDKVAQAAKDRAEIRADIEEIKNLLEVHIVERRNGGRRKTDPHE